MFVRTAGERDLDAVRALLAETWHATYDAIYGVEKINEINASWHSAESLRERMNRPKSEFILADDGKTIGGMAFAVLADEGATVLLKQLYVLPAMQGRGIGGMLLDEIEQAFPEATRIRLEVEPANARAVAFYLSQGFAKVGAVSDCGRAGSGIPADLYERPIVWAD